MTLIRVRNIVCLSALTAFAFGMCTATVRAQSPQQQSEQALTDLLNQDIQRNVGKALPSGIYFVDNKGTTIDLRSALQQLHGPAVVVVVGAFHCPPCQKLLGYIRQHPGDYMHHQKVDGKLVHLVVVRVKDPKHVSMQLPRGILELHTPGLLDSGFLASHGVPRAFYFDDQLTLVQRKVALVSPLDILLYPRSLPEQSPST